MTASRIAFHWNPSDRAAPAACDDLLTPLALNLGRLYAKVDLREGPLDVQFKERTTVRTTRTGTV